MSGKLLDDEIVKQLREVFNSELKHPVEILYFTKSDQCGTCEEVQLLLDELKSISDKLHSRTYDLNGNPQLALTYHAGLAPGLVITGLDGDKHVDYGVRFSGIPSGYEFGSLIHSILQVSQRDSGLRLETREKLKGLTAPVYLKVFVTPT